MLGLAVLLLAWAPRTLAADRVGLSAARRQLEESQGGHPLRGLCGMYKDFPAFQIGTLAPETGEFDTVANLTGIEAISQGVCLFAPNLFVTASDDAWQENQLFIVVSSDVSFGSLLSEQPSRASLNMSSASTSHQRCRCCQDVGGSGLRVLNVSRMAKPFRGKIELDALLGWDEAHGILALIDHDTFNPDPSAKGDVWEQVLAWVDLGTGAPTPLGNVSVMEKYGDCVAGVNAYDAARQMGYVYTVGFSRGADEVLRASVGCGGGGGCLVGEGKRNPHVCMSCIRRVC